MDYNGYSDRLEEASDAIQLKQAVSTKRKGKAGLRDKFVFGRTSWTEALSYVSIVQSVVIFTALVPEAVVTVNEFFTWTKIPIQLPVQISSVGAILFILFVFVFGLVAIRYLGMSRRGAELSSKVNPSLFLLWQKLDNIEKRLEDYDNDNENR